MTAILAALLMAVSFVAVAANTPCSGKKGGIAHCQGKKFVCNNGSISGSKKACNRDTYGKGKE